MLFQTKQTQHCIQTIISIFALFLFAHVALGASGHRGIVRFNELPVPGVTVIATQGDKQFVATTNLQGLYVFPELSDGVWTMRVDLTGFRSVSREVTVGPDSPAIEWELEMLPINEMKTESPQPGYIPPISLRAGSPRAAEDTSSTFANLTPEQLEERAADGFLINGSVNNAAVSPFAQRAAFGNNRRGLSSLYNGSINLFLNNSAFDARSYSLTGQNTPKPGYNRFQGSVSLGGPLIVPHLLRNGPSFFITYERTQNRDATIHTSRMPTLEERNGDLSHVLDPLGQAINIIDPDNGLQFPGNVVPQNRISPQAQSLLPLYPLPNYSGPGQYNYQVPIVTAMHQDRIRLQLYQWMRSSGTISGNFNYRNMRTDSPNVFDFLDTTQQSALGLDTNYSYRFNLHIGMNLKYSFERTATRTTPYFANRTNVSGEAGIMGNNQDPPNWGPPILAFSNYETLTDVQDSFNRNNTHAVSAAIRSSGDRHNFTFGFDIRRQQLNLFSQQNARGSFTVTGAATGYDFSDFLLGIPTTSSIAFGNADKYFRSSTYAAYIADDWRIRPGFTLNIGIRWEYEVPMTELYDRLVNLDIASDFQTADQVLAGDPVGLLTGRVCPDSLVYPDKRGIQPRLSFAWRPSAEKSLVIRGGYGIYRDTSVYLSIAEQMAQQSPFSKSFNIGNTPENPLTLANGFMGNPEEIANTFAIDPHFRVGYAQNWQLSLQYDLPMAMQIVWVYLGTKGGHLAQKSLPNTFPAGSDNECPGCPSGFVYLSSNGSSIRHAGQIQLRRRLRNGLAANIQYTFSKSIDDAALGTPSQGGQGGTLIAQNWRDLSAERALSNFDQRHQLLVRMQYTTGAGIAGGILMGGWKGTLLKGWTFAGQLTVGSGLPLTPIYRAAVYGTGITGSIRPDVTGVSVDEPPAGFFLNPAAYSAPASGHWGDAGRNSITGPRQFSLDASLLRGFRWRNRYNIEFRLNSMNLINHVTFPGWNTTINSAQFGLPNRANPMRTIQANLRVSF